MLITYPDDWSDVRAVDKEEWSGTAFTYLYAFSDAVPVQDQIQNVGHWKMSVCVSGPK